MKKLQDICAAYLEGYFYAKITEQLITSKIQSSCLDKNNYEHWADVTLDGIKQRLRDSDKLHE